MSSQPSVDADMEPEGLDDDVEVPDAAPQVCRLIGLTTLASLTKREPKAARSRGG